MLFVYILYNILDAECGLNILKQVVPLYWKPEIINSVRDRQFKSVLWLEYLGGNGIKINMDSKEHVLDKIFIERLWRFVKWISKSKSANKGNKLSHGLEGFDYDNHIKFTKRLTGEYLLIFLDYLHRILLKLLV